MEDFEQKYNELVEAVRAVVEGNPGLCDMNKRLGRVRDLLPEKESEDERIRKMLIDVYKRADMGGEIFGKGITYKQVIAWLEKQKEQPSTADDIAAAYQMGLAEGRKEQKPANSEKPKEWSEEDKSILNNIVAYKVLNIDDLEWLKSLPERFNPQPKQEWSEEDKLAIDRACVALRAYSNGDLPEFLPSELLGYADRLKSLRPQPHWKPTKEQMEALMLAIEGKWEAIMPTGYMSRRLEDLYEGLANTFKVECKLEK